VAGHAWTVLARLQVSRGRLAEARVAAERALAVQRDTGHRIADADPGAVLVRLRRLSRPSRPSGLRTVTDSEQALQLRTT